MTTVIARPRGTLDPASVSIIETLRDGREVEIRALQPTDREALKAAVARIGSASLYRRFFSPKRQFTEAEVDFFVNIDFIEHVALVATADSTIIGGARYITVRPGVAELAFAIVDEYQGQGLGSALLRHLISLAREAGLTELTAHVLPDNRPMLSVFEKCGLRLSKGHEDGAVSLRLTLSAPSDTSDTAQSAM